MECSICNQQLLEDMEHITCAECGNVVCVNCAKRCDNCSRDLCENCALVCGDCNNTICDNCAEYCYACRMPFCSDCLDGCYCGDHPICHTGCHHDRLDCGCRVAPCDAHDCSACGSTICGECSYYCDSCGHDYCNGCFNGDAGYCCGCSPEEEEPDTRGIFDHDYKPEWQCSKQAWENTVYLGIELEMNYHTSKQSEVDAIVNKYVPTGKYLFKYDGSIGEGAELVLHPMTLQYMRTLNLRAMLNELSAFGVRSYESGLCGLHVHISRDSFGKHINKAIPKMHAFFHSCSELITRFTQRTPGQLGQWAAITKQADPRRRYCAINICNDETIEIRIFRGTLDWTRFWASLQFCEALVYFVRTHGKLALEVNGWNCFRSFVQGSIYGGLRRYLDKRFGTFSEGGSVCA